MEQNIFQDNLKVPNLKINSPKKEFLVSSEGNNDSKIFFKKHKWTLLFLVILTALFLFVNGMSVYKNNLFIN